MKGFALAAAAILTAASVAAQSLPITVFGGDLYRVVEKHNFRRRIDGKYQGAAYREIRGVLARTVEPGQAGATSGGRFGGSFHVFEETKHEARLVARRIQDTVTATLVVGPDGAAVPGTEGRFPTMRGFPSLPSGPVRPGDKWQRFAERVLDPDFSGRIARVRVYVDYTYTGPENFRGHPGHRFTAKYAVRYRAGADPAADPNLREVSGTHDATIFVASEAGGPMFITETFRELYRYTGSAAPRQVELEGTILTFFESVIPMDRPGTIEDLKRGLDRARVAAADPGVPPLDDGSAAAPRLPPATGPIAPPVAAGSAVGPPTATGPIAPPVAAAAPPAAPLKDPKPSLRAPSESPIAVSEAADIELEARPEGVALTVRNLRFRADSAELLPDERPRLAVLAEALGEISGRSIVVTGHTASVGRPEAEMRLSIERAKAIVDELTKRGIAADRLAFGGRGSEAPAASNATEEGRARNRRVEILVVED